MQNILTKQYNRKSSTIICSAFTFNLVWSITVLLFFILISGGTYVFNSRTLFLASLFAICYAVATIFNVLAIRYGPLSLSSLIVSYSLIIPSLFGIIFLHEPFKAAILLGTVLLLISLLLINLKKGDTAVTLKWSIYAFFAFLGNGFCSSVQKLHQIEYPGMYRHEFMIAAMIIVTIINFIALLIVRKDNISNSFHLSIKYSVPAGVFNSVVNLLMMMLAVKLPASFMFPVISAGGIVMTLIASIALYKERLSKRQLIGFVMGMASIIVLNI